MNKTIDSITQEKLNHLVQSRQIEEAHLFEAELRKNNLDAVQGTCQLTNAETAGMTCYENKWDTPFWVKQCRHLQQLFAHGWKLQQNKVSL